MPILVKCDGCQAKMNAPDTAAGKRVKCPKCGTAVTVPGAAPSKVAAAPAPKPAKKAPPPSADDAPSPKKTAPVARSEGASEGEDFLRELTEDEAEQVRSEIKEKERVLWAGKPSIKLLVIRSLPVALLGGIFFIAAPIVFFSMRGPGGHIDMVGVLIAVGVGLAGMALGTAPLFAKKKARRTFYVLSNKRALVWKGGIFWGTSFEEYTAMQLGNMKRQNSWFVGGAGDLVFKEEVHITTTHHAGSRTGGSYRHGRHRGGSYTPGHTTQSVQIVQHGFMALANVSEVESLIKRKIIEKMQKALEAAAEAADDDD